MNAEQRLDLWLWLRIGRNRNGSARDKFYGMYKTLMSLRDRRIAA